MSGVPFGGVGSMWLRSGALALAALASGCAGSKSSVDDEAPGPFVLIDDMEGDSGRILWRPASGADDTTPGRWDTEAGAQCGDIVPPPSYLGGDWPRATIESPYRTFSTALSRQAVRLYTTAPLENTWGATLAFDFAKKPFGPNQPVDAGDTGDPPTCTPPAGVERDSRTPALDVDLRAYRGVTFFARARPEAGTTAIFVKLHDRNTDPRGNVCEPVLGSDRECYNAFGTRVVLDQTFRRHTVFFEDFQQELRWGYQPPEGMADLEHVFSLVFQVRTPGGPCDPPSECPGALPQLSFDVWIDDLAFVER